MTPAGPTYCACGRHLIDPFNSRNTCPVCLDEIRREAEAKVVALGWRVWGTAAAVLALLVTSGCGPEYSDKAVVKDHFHPITVELPDGGSVMCVQAGNSNSIDCDWANAK